MNIFFQNWWRQLSEDWLKLRCMIHGIQLLTFYNCFFTTLFCINFVDSTSNNRSPLKLDNSYMYLCCYSTLSNSIIMFPWKFVSFSFFLALLAKIFTFGKWWTTWFESKCWEIIPNLLPLVILRYHDTFNGNHWLI